MPSAIGTTFAGYTMLRLLGVSGMGGVHLAQHPQLVRKDAPKLLRPVASNDADYQSRSRRQPATSLRRALHRRQLLGMTAAALAAIVVAIMAWHPWTRESSMVADPSSHSAAAQRQPAPLTGVFIADYGPEVELGSGQGLNPEGAQGTLEIRSACTPAGCVAIAKAANGPTINRALIFDDIDGQWVSVATAASTSPAISRGLKGGCEQGLSPEVWESLSLQPQPDGALTGEYEVADANNCNTSRTITLRRTGDVDRDGINDPAALPPRKPSPAAGFHGHYRYTHSSSADSHDVEGIVETRCLRTGERCESYFNEPESGEPFIFANGQWTLHYSAPVSCGSAIGPRVRIDRSAKLDLPQPTSNPIRVLTGQGQEIITSGPCPINEIFDLRFERTGD